MNDLLQRAFNFLAVNDFPTLLESIRKMTWGGLVRNPLAWLVVLPIVIALVWTKSIKLITVLVSLILFICLLQFTLPPMGDKIPLHDLLIFCGGAMALILLNLYLLFIRE
jgi:Na+/citrate or Na+/malate symporter